MASGTASDGEFGLQIAPLLDVLFVLLLFFMVTAGSSEREAELTADLPGVPAFRSTTETPAQLKVHADGRVSLNDAYVDGDHGTAMPELIARLDSLRRQFGEPTVLLLPDAQARHQRVVDVLNACATAKIKNLAFGAPQS